MKYSVAFHPEEIVRIEIDNAINEDDALEMAWDELDRLLLTGELTAKGFAWCLSEVVECKE